jgi:hypothetical protein
MKCGAIGDSSDAAVGSDAYPDRRSVRSVKKATLAHHE